MKRIVHILLSCAALCLAACGSKEPAAEKPSVTEEPVPAETAAAETPEPADPASLLYLGHASIRITTPEDKVIYIDPYAGSAYDEPADLILVTHDHYDHNQTDLIANRSDDCSIITWNEALAGGTHNTFDLGYVTVEAVEAGNNPNHDINACVGYVLTLSDGIKVYVSGDTSRTAQMEQMCDMHIDYAFYCCDGQYNMNTEEAGECAKLVNAKHNIPYHTIVQDGVYFDLSTAEAFPEENRLILHDGDAIELVSE